MKKTVAMLMLTSLALSLTSTAASATEVSKTTTNGTIEFLPGSGSSGENTVDPGDKEAENPDPDKEVTPQPPGESTEGALRLTFVPHLNFGKNEMSSKKAEYDVEYQKVVENGTTVSRNNYFEVEDLRGGTKGWSVTLSNNSTFTAAGADNVMAYLSVSDMTIQSNSGQGADKKPTLLNGVASATFVEVKDSQAVTLVSADGAKKQGYGNWSVRFGSVTTAVGDRNPAIKLTVPAGQIIEAGKSYSTDLVWAINDTK